MALLSDLVRIVAAVEGLEEVSVGIFARHAREAGYIAQGGRGRSAAKMSFKDAANLLIAVNGCSLAKDVLEKVKLIRNLPADSGNIKATVGIGEPGNLFGDDLERLIELFSKRESDEDLYSQPGATSIKFYRPDIMVGVELNQLPGKGRQPDNLTYGKDLIEHIYNGPDRWDETGITSITLRAVAEALK